MTYKGARACNCQAQVTPSVEAGNVLLGTDCVVCFGVRLLFHCSRPLPWHGDSVCFGVALSRVVAAVAITCRSGFQSQRMQVSARGTVDDLVEGRSGKVVERRGRVSTPLDYGPPKSLHSDTFPVTFLL